MTTIAIVNACTKTPELTSKTLSAILRALRTQLGTTYPKACETAPRTVVLAKSLGDVKSDAVPLVLLDDSDTAGALGYHDVTPDGRPYGRAFTRPTLDHGGSLVTGPNSVSVTISHEAIEIDGNAYANRWVDGPGAEYAAEECDPVEGDSYDSGGVALSNFVLPPYFSAVQGAAYDFLGRLVEPFSMTMGGYLIVRSPGHNVHTVQLHFGSAMPEWKRAEKRASLHVRRRGYVHREAA